jgi:ornithine cyclodeaminase/alanine dehydrogenase-like protein (mu-crystallin family)
LKFFSADDVAKVASTRDWVEALRDGFKMEIASPVRHHHQNGAASTLLIMPAWSKEWTGIKTVVLKSDNAAKGLPTIQAGYQLIGNDTGATVAVMDGTELTRRRTAAASALAADYLARPDAATLLVVGAGALCTHFARAHASVRTIKKVLIFNRSRERAELAVSALHEDSFNAQVCDDLETGVRAADIVTCITSSTTALVKGAWLKRGTHVDLAGAYKPAMRETDADTVARSRVFVDTREGAEAEAGDLLQARDEGRFDFKDVQGDLAQLCKGAVKGRKSPDEVTLFKSCGTAIEDLAAAAMVYLRSK